MRWFNTSASTANILLAAVISWPIMTAGIGRTTDFESRLLAAQNRARDELGLPALVWDRRLELDARTYANQLARIGHLVHSIDDPDNRDPEGENLWAGTKGFYTAEDMIGLWTKERRFYIHHIFPNVSSTGKLEDVGHYTQVIWRSTTRVGCALSTGMKDEFVVCRYAEGGNVIGEMVY